MLLTDRAVDADDVFVVLIDDGVDGNRGLAGLPVADDELALAAADREHRVDRLDAGLHRRVDVLTRDHARRDDVHAARRLGVDRTLAIDRDAERIHDATNERVAGRRLDDAAGRAHLVALFDLLVLAEDDRRDGVLFEVEREAEGVLAEVEQLRGHAPREAVDARDAVADLHHRPDVDGLRFSFEALDLRLDDVGDL